MSPTSAKSPRLALDRADEAMEPVDRSKYVGKCRREDQVGDGYVASGSNCGSEYNTVWRPGLS